jgi:hypothetical protein
MRTWRLPEQIAENERDFSLRRPTFLQEQKGKKKSACCVRNDGMSDAGGRAGDLG